MSLKKFIDNQVIAPLRQKFNKSVPATYKISKPEGALYMSDLMLVDIKFEDDSDPIHVLVKRWPNVEADVIIFKAMFDNEIEFYTRYASSCTNRLPKLYHFHYSNQDSFLVIENVNYRGFHLSKKAFDLDLDHIMACVKEIAIFHSCGYEMKLKKPDEFKQFISKICDWKYDTNNTKFMGYVNAMATRGLKYLNSIKYDPDFCTKMEQVLGNSFGVLTDCHQKVEPLATLCHGDFLRNNILFRVGKGTVDAMLIDFATIKYSTPSMDLSTFFYMSCSRLDILHNFQEIFELYCSILHKCLREKGVPVENFGTKVLMEDYKRNAIQGYIIATFYLSNVIYGKPEGHYFNDPLDKYIVSSMKLGGEKHTMLLAEMLIDLRSLGYLDRFLT